VQSFHPVISNKTRGLASTRRGSISNVQAYLYEEGMKSKQRKCKSPEPMKVISHTISSTNKLLLQNRYAKIFEDISKNCSEHLDFTKYSNRIIRIYHTRNGLYK
jgi:hypothetical protein